MSALICSSDEDTNLACSVRAAVIFFSIACMLRSMHSVNDSEIWSSSAGAVGVGWVLFARRWQYSTMLMAFKKPDLSHLKVRLVACSAGWRANNDWARLEGSFAGRRDSSVRLSSLRIYGRFPLNASPTRSTTRWVLGVSGCGGRTKWLGVTCGREPV